MNCFTGLHKNTSYKTARRALAFATRYTNDRCGTFFKEFVRRRPNFAIRLNLMRAQASSADNEIEIIESAKRPFAQQRRNVFWQNIDRFSLINNSHLTQQLKIVVIRLSFEAIASNCDLHGSILARFKQ
ncbi:hypothetical protein D9M69_549070 [compost metagenome]